MTNRTFEELEKRCKRLNNRFYFKFFLFFIVVVTLLGVSFGYLNLKSTKSLHVKKDIKKIKIVPEKSDKKDYKLKETKNQKTKSKPKKEIFPTQKIEVKDKNITKKAPNKKILYDTVFLRYSINLSDNDKPKEKEKMVNQTENKVKKSEKKLKIKVKSFPTNEAFLKNNISKDSYESYMNLANYYFKREKFKKAIYYSKKANQLSPKKEEPWLIYIKAKIKEGKKDEAIKTLRTFLSYFNSKEGVEILNSLRSQK